MSPMDAADPSTARPAGDTPMPLDPAPVPPTEPDPADCCGEGCVRCVFDRYDEALERYQRALAAWQARQR
jgi:hypothetical protein